MTESTASESTPEGSTFERTIEWLSLHVLGEEERPTNSEDPEVIKLMAHQHSFLM